MSPVLSLLLAWSAPSVQAAPELAAWQTSLTTQAAVQWRVDPVAAQAIWDTPVGRTRNGLPVITVAVPTGMGAVVAERLVKGGGDADERVALVDWLRRSEADFGPWLVGALAEESDPRVRAVMVASLRYAGGISAVDGVRRGLQDGEAQVRAAAAQAAGYLEAPSLAADLQAATQDSDDQVAGLAARSLGWRGDVAAFDAVSAVLTRADGRTRLYAVRALQRLDPARTARLPAIAALASDPDPRVARAVARLR